MMPKRVLSLSLLMLMLILPGCGDPEPAPPATEEPAADLELGAVRLILVLVVDQCTAEYIDRFAPLFDGGIHQLRKQGLSFTEAHHFHSVTATAVGHATLATGCFPSRHGIVGNSWYDRESGERIYSAEDDEHLRSPHLMLSPAIGDWLKAAATKGRVYAASAKDRAAITMGGKKADGAFWYDSGTGRYESSSYYYPEDEPGWLVSFNDRGHANEYFGQAWEPLPLSPDQLSAAGIADTDFGPLHPRFPRVFGTATPAAERYFFEGLADSPFGDELLARFGRQIIEAEELGADGTPDILCLSFSALDWVGHDFGPNSRAVLDTMLRLDGYLGELFDFIDGTVGLDHTLIAFTGDHGVAPVPEFRQEQKQPGSRLTAQGVLCFQEAAQRMDEQFGEQDWFLPGPFLNPTAVETSGKEPAEMELAAARILAECPSVQRVWTRSELQGDAVSDDPAFQLFRNSHHVDRSPDFLVQYEPFHTMTRGSATTHGTPHRYDTHVPLILLGPGIPAGVIHDRVNSVDLVPTLAELAGIPLPGEIDGRSLVPVLSDVRVVLEEEEVAAAILTPLPAAEPPAEEGAITPIPMH